MAKLRIEEEDDRASWEGQWCHYMSAKRFVEAHGAMAPEPGLPLPRIPKGYEPAGIANWIVDFYHRAVMEETPGDWAMAVEDFLEWEFNKFWLEGHPDVYALDSSALALNFDDLKSGVNIVDPADQNWQVLGYAALFKLTFDSLRRIRGRIIQPRAHEDDGAGVKRISAMVIDEKGVFDGEGFCTMDGLTIHNFVERLVQRVDFSLENNMRLKTGKQCRWCPADLQCPCLQAERTKMEMELTKDALDKIEATPNDQTLADWAYAKKLLGPKLEKAWDIFKERLAAAQTGIFTDKDGRQFVLRDWKGPRHLSDAAKAEVWATVCEELDEERAFAVMDISINALEKAYAAQLDIPLESKKKDSGQSQVVQKFGKFITRKEGKQLTVV